MSQLKQESSTHLYSYCGVEFPIHVLQTLADDCAVGGDMSDQKIWDICSHVSHLRHGLIRKHEDVDPPLRHIAKPNTCSI